MSTLLLRTEFKDQVFKRDHDTCILCNKLAVDAHHIIDRSLFENGGYYLDNGVALCADHHLEAERTTISCKSLREHAGITTIILPEHLDTSEEYDHWGNIILPTGARLRGELFFQENVQKALKAGGVLQEFLLYVKYPRTYHLPKSPNLQNDDRKHTNVHSLFQKPIIATIKFDGENTTFYSDYIHARSLDSVNHPSRTWVKALHGSIAHEIPTGWRISGENLFAKHSIYYEHLKSYFYVFSIWDDKNEALSWKDTVDYCNILGLHTVPVFHTGISCESLVHEEFEKYSEVSPDSVEGYVVRAEGKIPYHQFKTLTAKYVRANHVHTDKFWMNQPVIPNKIEPGPIYLEQEMGEIRKFLLEIQKRFNRFYRPNPIYNPNPLYNIIKASYDMITLKEKIKKEIEYYRDKGPLILNLESHKELHEVYEVLFCDLIDIPLLINGCFPEIAKWRLNIGK